jgi:hypothetical protein
MYLRICYKAVRERTVVRAALPSVVQTRSESAFAVSMVVIVR